MVGDEDAFYHADYMNDIIFSISNPRVHGKAKQNSAAASFRLIKAGISITYDMFQGGQINFSTLLQANSSL